VAERLFRNVAAAAWMAVRVLLSAVPVTLNAPETVGTRNVEPRTLRPFRIVVVFQFSFNPAAML
jgi:hypothetical protein